MHETPDLDLQLDSLEGDLTSIATDLVHEPNWGRVRLGVRRTRIYRWLPLVGWTAVLGLGLASGLNGEWGAFLVGSWLGGVNLHRSWTEARDRDQRYAAADQRQLLELLEEDYRAKRKEHVNWIGTGLLSALFFGLVILPRAKSPAFTAAWVGIALLVAAVSLLGLLRTRRYAPAPLEPLELEEDLDQ